MLFGSDKRIIIDDLISLDNLKTACNKVLIRIDRIVLDDTTESGLTVCADPDWDEAASCNTHGIVVKVPNVLIRREKPWQNYGMEHGTEIEIEEGDLVWFTKKSSYGCPAVLFEDNLYYLIDYSELILAKRGNETIMLNGYILMDKTYEELKSEYLNLQFSKKENLFEGNVIEVGRPNDWYMLSKDKDPTEIKKGDRILSKIANINVETSIIKTIGEYTYMNARWILAIL